MGHVAQESAAAYVTFNVGSVQYCLLQESVAWCAYGRYTPLQVPGSYANGHPGISAFIRC